MIHVVVGTSHFCAHSLEPLVGKPILTVNTPDDLARVTVFEVLEDFHKQASELLCADPAEIMTARRDEIMRVARDDYHCPDFEATIEDACRSVAIHGLFPHGTVTSRKAKVFLPDFSIAVRCFGFFAWSFSSDCTIKHLWDNRHAHNLQKLECHMCDTLRYVYDQADNYWKELRTAADNDLFKAVVFDTFKRDLNEEYLVIDSVARGFQGHRSLRRDNPEVPVLGNHRLLTGKATRQGIGKPVVSSLFPIALWQRLGKPVQHFILNAAEKVGAEECPPLYPNIPSEHDMEQLYWAASRTAGDAPFEVENYSNSLRKLGIDAAVRRRIAAYGKLREAGKWALDWTEAIFEYKSALYDDDIEQSLHLQDRLDLYPLHKRVLGVLERVIVPKLLTDGDAATRLRHAFADTRHAHSADPRIISAPQDGIDTSLEISGGWLVYSKDLNAKNPKPSSCCLAMLIEEFVGRINKYFSGGSFQLATASLTPAGQAKQLDFLCQPSLSGRRCLQAMVNVIINLRNFIEHGIDEVDDSGLMITNSEFWQRLIGNTWARKYLPKWREEAKLPRDSTGQIDPPPLADKLLLTPVSLEYCLVLVSLVLQAGISHLGI